MSRAASHLAIRSVRGEAVQMEGVYRKKSEARELLTKEKKGSLLDQDIFGGRDQGRVFLKQPASSFCGNGEGPCDSLSHWCLSREFQTGWLKFCFCKRLKQQLGQIVAPGLVPWALAQVMPFRACGFLFDSAN